MPVANYLLMLYLRSTKFFPHMASGSPKQLQPLSNTAA